MHSDRHLALSQSLMWSLQKCYVCSLSIGRWNYICLIRFFWGASVLVFSLWLGGKFRENKDAVFAIAPLVWCRFKSVRAAFIYTTIIHYCHQSFTHLYASNDARMYCSYLSSVQYLCPISLPHVKSPVRGRLRSIFALFTLDITR